MSVHKQNCELITIIKGWGTRWLKKKSHITYGLDYGLNNNKADESTPYKVFDSERVRD